MTSTLYMMDVLSNLSIFFGLAGIIALGVAAIALLISTVEEEPRIRKHCTKLFVGGIIALLVTTAIPSYKTMVAMYVLPKLMANEKVANLPDVAVDALTQRLKDWAKDGSADKED